MKESSTLADSVIISQLQREVLLSIKELCMKESNTLADIAATSQLQRVILLATKDLFMKESRPCWSFLAIQYTMSTE